MERILTLQINGLHRETLLNRSAKLPVEASNPHHTGFATTSDHYWQTAAEGSLTRRKYFLHFPRKFGRASESSYSGNYAVLAAGAASPRSIRHLMRKYDPTVPTEKT